MKCKICNRNVGKINKEKLCSTCAYIVKELRNYDKVNFDYLLKLLFRIKIHDNLNENILILEMITDIVIQTCRTCKHDQQGHCRQGGVCNTYTNMNTPSHRVLTYAPDRNSPDGCHYYNRREEET